jgi:hypothetical protein
MIESVEYILPIGQPDTLGRFKSSSWREFLRWVFALTDSVVLWSLCPRTTIANWLGISPEDDIMEFSHPDPACRLKGYRVKSTLINEEVFAGIRASEESGIAFFSWQRADVVLASLDVDDFENFIVLYTDRADAVRLARACSFDGWPPQRFAEYKTEIDSLSTAGRWASLAEVLHVEG